MDPVPIQNDEDNQTDLLTKNISSLSLPPAFSFAVSGVLAHQQRHIFKPEARTTETYKTALPLISWLPEPNINCSVGSLFDWLLLVSDPFGKLKHSAIYI